jgi:hypothetical protein
MHVYLHILRAQKFHEKQIFFMAFTKKKDKKKYHEKACFSIKFCHFYINLIKSRLFLKRLYGYVQDGDVHKIFLFRFFCHF